MANAIVMVGAKLQGEAADPGALRTNLSKTLSTVDKGIEDLSFVRMMLKRHSAKEVSFEGLTNTLGHVSVRFTRARYCLVAVKHKFDAVVQPHVCRWYQDLTAFSQHEVAVAARSPRKCCAPRLSLPSAISAGSRQPSNWDHMRWCFSRVEATIKPRHPLL